MLRKQGKRKAGHAVFQSLDRKRSGKRCPAFQKEIYKPPVGTENTSLFRIRKSGKLQRDGVSGKYGSISGRIHQSDLPLPDMAQIRHYHGTYWDFPDGRPQPDLCAVSEVPELGVGTHQERIQRNRRNADRCRLWFLD